MAQSFTGSAPRGRILEERPNSFKELPNIHPQEMGTSRPTVEWNGVSTLPSSKLGNDNITLYDPAVPYILEPEEADVGEARIGLGGTYTSPRLRSQLQDPEETRPDARPPDRNVYHGSQYGLPATMGSRQSGSACSEYTSASTMLTLATRQPTMIMDVAPNIVIFGETGVGKSSIINLIAGRRVARTSNGARGCTFQHEQHIITLDGASYVLWDTAGLEEGSEGRVPAALAEANLRALIQELAHAGGIHLVIYCIRAGRATKALQHNYHLFYVTVCRKKVPVALVVTGLEHQQDGMETWWYENEEELRRSGMRFDAHACVTTLDDEDQTIRRRRSDSQDRLRDLVLEYSRLPPWRIRSSFISWVLPAFHDALRRTFSAGRPGNTKTTRKVIICDMAEDSQPLSELCPGITAVWKRFDGLIGDKQYEFVRMDKCALQTPTSTSQNVGGAGAGVLVFYTSALVDTGISPKDVGALEAFYAIAGGQTCPLIVVLRGCDDEAAARMLWSDILRHSGIQAHLTFLPSTVDGQSDAREKLNEVIERLCVEHVEVVSSGLSKRFLAAIMAVRASHWIRDEKSETATVQNSQDMSIR